MADDEQFSLCWNNFNSNLSAGFHESLCRGDLVDVTLAAEGQLVKAHRLVLSVCSPYFRKMFTQMPANQHAFVFLKDVSHSALKDLIQFMYCGEVNVKQEALPAFISTAEALQIKGLTDSDPPAQTPSEPTTPTPQIPQIQTSPRIRQQRTAASTRSYKIETVDETSNDSKPQTTQIVIQTTAAPVSQPTAITITQPATVVHHHQQQHHIQAQQHHHQQQLQSQSHQLSAVSIPSGGVSSVATTTTHVVGSSNKRPAQRSSLGSANHIKRTKSSTVDPLEGADVNASGAVSAAAQQITIQTAIVSDTKAQQQQNETAEYIDLPLDLPTKSEPDYTDDTGEVDPNEQDATYVEDESYGDMRYDESYFTENEDGGGGGGVVTTGSVTTTAGNINVSNTSNAGNVNIGIGNVTGGGGIGGPAAATTSKAIVKQQQSTSFSDSSYADGTDQTNNDAQDDSRSDVKYYRIPANLPKILDGKFYNNILPNKKTRGGIQATCTSCFSVIAGTAKSTGNFLSHIKRRHKDLLGNCQVYCSAKNILPDEFDLNLPFYKQPAFYDHPVKYAKRAVKVYKKKSIKATEIKVEGKNGNSCSGGSGSAGGRHDDNDSRSVDYIDEILKIKCEPTRKDSCSSNNSITTDRSNSNTETNATPRITTISTSERKPANGVYKEPPALLKVLK